MNFKTKSAIEHLLSETIHDLNSEDRKQKIEELKALLQIISAIESRTENLKGVKDVHVLPDSKTGYSDFRIMDDVDSDNRSLWLEVEGLKLSQGDLVIEIKG